MEGNKHAKFPNWKFSALAALAMLTGAILGSLPMLPIALGWFP